MKICEHSLKAKRLLFLTEDGGSIPACSLQPTKKFIFYVKETEKNLVGKFIQKFHYSPVFPRLTKFWLGVYDRKNKMVGAITLGWGTQPKQTIKKRFPTLDTKDYLEIGKMCMDDKMKKNSETQMLKAVFKWIKKTIQI